MKAHIRATPQALLEL